MCLLGWSSSRWRCPKAPISVVFCKRFRVYPRTAYKWIKRYESDGPAGLENQSRRPHYSPKHTPKNIESQILAVRDQHPSWGGRKIQDTVLQVRPTIYTIILEVLRDLHMLAQFEKMQLVIVHIEPEEIRPISNHDHLELPIPMTALLLLGIG